MSVIAISVIPCLFNSSTVYCIMGFPTSSTMGLGPIQSSDEAAFPRRLPNHCFHTLLLQKLIRVVLFFPENYEKKVLFFIRILGKTSNFSDFGKTPKACPPHIIHGGGKAMEDIVNVQNVSLKYQSPNGEIEAISNIDFAVKPAEFVSIVGPSGCGQIHAALCDRRASPPTAGKVYVNGEVVTKTSPMVGYMLQKDHLFSWRTIWQNVTLGLEVQKMQNGGKYRLRQRPAEDIWALWVQG